MTEAGTPSPAARSGPRRTCLGCRGVWPQGDMLRVTRGAEGTVEPDPAGTKGGRGAYLCRRERCLREALRRGRWAQAFRAPTVVTPDGLAGLRALVMVTAGESRETDPPRRAGDGGDG